jgi:hypothetical protein
LCSSSVALSLAVLIVSIAANASAASVPAASTPLTIRYTGSFTMSNIENPPRTLSYTYSVKWAYSWSGTWGELFDGTTFRSNQTRFESVQIAGTVKATFRDKVDGPDIRCTMRVAANPSNPPSFRASYDTADGTLQVAYEAPTFGQSRLVDLSHPRCVGGPGVAVTGQPADWSPLGGGQAVVSLEKGGSDRFDKTWHWVRSFAGGEKRTVDASIHETASVSLTAGCDTTGSVQRAPAGHAQKQQVRIFHRGKDVTGALVPVAIGQRIVLRVECDGEDESSAIWKIAGATRNAASTTAVSDYKIFDTGGSSHTTFRSVPTGPRAVIAFNFIRSPRSPLRVSARSRNGVASVRFRIAAPAVVFGELTSTCTVGIAEEPSGKKTFLTLALGWWTPECPGGPGDPFDKGRPGIRWDWVVTARSALEQGTVAMVQLIWVDVNHNGIPCGQDNVHAVADDSAFFPTSTPAGGHGSKAVTVTTGADARWRGRDSPRLRFENKLGSLVFWGKWYESFYAKDVLMFRPADGGREAIWAPIAQTEWKWWGYVNRSGPGKPFTLGAHQDPGQLRLRRNPGPPLFDRAQPSGRFFAFVCA